MSEATFTRSNEALTLDEWGVEWEQTCMVCGKIIKSNEECYEVADWSGDGVRFDFAHDGCIAHSEDGIE